MSLEETIKREIVEQVASLGRPDLFREALVSFSAAADPRFEALKTVVGEWHQSPGELLPGAASVISYFVPFTKAVATQPKAVPHGSELWSEAYQEINRHFVAVNEAVAALLEGLGHAAMAIRPTHTYDPKDLKCFFSHRSAAAIAGLGTFGANRLLITKKGSGGRFCTVITTAILEPNSQPAEEKCLYQTRGSCGLCFRVCPVKALEPDSMRKFDCQDELNKNGAIMRETTSLHSADTCGKCISVCPHAFIA